MKIVGRLTQYGEKILADFKLNGEKYEIHEIAAGSGDTAVTSEHLTDRRQTLTASTELDENGNTVHTAYLSMAGAQSSYTLTEIGVYAITNISVLFKVYTLSEPIFIDNTQPHIIKFTFRDLDTIKAWDSITIKPEQVITAKLLSQSIDSLYIPSDEKEVWSISGLDLADKLKELPKCITKHYVINITDKNISEIALSGKYGPGSVTINGDFQKGTYYTDYCVVYGSLCIENCSVRVNIKNMKIFPSVSNTPYSVYLNNAKEVYMERCAIGSANENINLLGLKRSHLIMKNSVTLEICGSGKIYIEDSSSWKLDYKKSMCDAILPFSGRYGQIHIKDYSTAVFSGDMTDSYLSDLSFFVNSSCKISKTNADSNSYVRIY